MEVASIKGNVVSLLYHPAEGTATVGELLSLLEMPNGKDGLIAQVIANETLSYEGLTQELIQSVLERRMASVHAVYDREQGMAELKCLKLARAIIRRRVGGGIWHKWDGWIPTRNLCVRTVPPEELFDNILLASLCPLSVFASYRDTPFAFDGSLLDMVSLIVGAKGLGKSHLAKWIAYCLGKKGVPCIIIDFNGEFTTLPGAQNIRWKHNFRMRLSEVGASVLISVIKSIYPLQPGSASESVFENTVREAFRDRAAECRRQGQPFNIDLMYLRSVPWSNSPLVFDAIDERLKMVEEMCLFQEECRTHGDMPSRSLCQLYEDAAAGQPIVINLRGLPNNLREALVKGILIWLERKCESESNKGTNRFPFLIADEAHFYADEATILNVITRGRHIGLASIWVTNTPQKLPVTLFQQLDNLFVVGLTHDDDVRAVSKTSLADAETIQSVTTRLRPHHALVVGNVTGGFPLVVEVAPLPDEIPASGRTRSTWSREL